MTKETEIDNDTNTLLNILDNIIDASKNKEETKKGIHYMLSKHHYRKYGE